METLNRADALTVLKESLTDIVPDADFDRLRPDDPFRDALELDSLDFLTLVEILSQRTGVHIDESDYPRLTTLADSVDFLVERTG
ncbi:acyl carrier protein [Streptomyces sp. NPDC006624]|uniref:acyl carrier protein n=1 Tax=unclassified Streptomyces TaxID=2593676 RepID=UPI0033A572E7